MSVKVPEAEAPAPATNVWKLPKLEPVGVFSEVEPSPVNVIMSALPIPPLNVTELVPLPVQPPQVKVPEVEKVTGSAFALDAAKAIIPPSRAVIRNIFVRRNMLVCSLLDIDDSIELDLFEPLEVMRRPNSVPDSSHPA